MKCIDLLIQDHKIILRALYTLQEMAERVESGKTVAPEDVETILGFLRAFEDNYHQAKEESALFPELMRTSGANEARLRHMIFEHDQERSLVNGLEEALHTQNGMAFVRFANSLVQLISTHIFKEDNILFPIAEETLSAKQDERVSAEFAKFEIDGGYLADLRRLEWTYLKHAAYVETSLTGSRSGASSTKSM
jgi:hemerythrin-like domain-containing protein